MGVPITPMVRPSFSIAAVWAAVLIPEARPETMVNPSSTRFFTRRRVRAIPFSDGLRVLMTETDLA